MSVLNEPPILKMLIFLRLEDGSPTLPCWREDANNFAQAASGGLQCRGKKPAEKHRNAMETSPATVAINVF